MSKKKVLSITNSKDVEFLLNKQELKRLNSLQEENRDYVINLICLVAIHELSISTILNLSKEIDTKVHIEFIEKFNCYVFNKKQSRRAEAEDINCLKHGNEECCWKILGISQSVENDMKKSLELGYNVLYATVNMLNETPVIFTAEQIIKEEQKRRLLKERARLLEVIKKHLEINELSHSFFKDLSLLRMNKTEKDKWFGKGY